MQIFLNIAITFALMFWPIMFMMSPMMLGAPGADNDKSALTGMLLFLCYPVGIFLLLWIFNGSYFGFRGFTLTIISIVVIALAFSLFGYISLFSNLARGIANSGYSIADDQVYYDGKLIETADSESFIDFKENEFRSSWHAKDKNYFYYSGVIVEGAIPDNIQKTDINGDVYWLNSTQVIYGDKILPGANPDKFSGFEDFRGWTYSISNGQYFVYINGKRLPDVDKDTFTPLSEFIGKDKSHIFEQDKMILSETDARNFELFDDHSFGKDNNYIYYMAHVKPFAIEGIDLESFEILDWSYLKDKNHIYYTHQYKSIEKLNQIDVASFEITDYDESTNSHARDKNHYYYGAKIVGDRE